MCFSVCPPFITLIVSLVISSPDDQICMYFERWVQRTLIHKSLGNETPSVLDKKKLPLIMLFSVFLRSLIDSERGLMAKHLDSSNAALMEDKCYTNSFQHFKKTKQFVFLLSTFINRSIEFQLKKVIRRKWRNEEMNRMHFCWQDKQGANCEKG